MADVPCPRFGEASDCRMLGAVSNRAAHGVLPRIAGRRLLLVLWFCGAIGAMLSCAADTGPTAIPNTPAGRVFRAWLDAYNAADSARLEAYARRFEPAMSVHSQLVFREQTGRWDIVSVERSDLTHLEVMLRTGEDPLRKYSNSITMYGFVDLSDTATSRAQTTFTLIGTGVASRVNQISRAQRALAIDSVVAKLVGNYVFPEVAERVADSLRARRARGVYDDYTNEISFAHRLNGDLLELGRDRQIAVEYAWRVPLPPPVPTPPAMLHCGLEPARVLKDSVGYVKFYGFREPERDCGHEVSQVMNSVAGTRALIIDLRENGGGSSSMMAYLAAYLVSGCTHLEDVWDRRTGRANQIWTTDGLPGPAFGGRKPLYILTSLRTFSAAEGLAYALKTLRRATIVGETTGGGAHITALGQIGEHLLVRVPVARAVNPITGTNWQAVGVKPDVSVRASEALAVTQRLIRQGHVVPKLTATSELSNSFRAAQQTLAPIDRAPLARGGALTIKPPQLRRGIRFVVDTFEASGSRRGPLTRVAGVVEFADGRGRFDVTAVRPAPAVSLNGITIEAPLAKPGDYYLFDNMGFILVRPATRTFSSFVFTRAEFNHTGDLLPGAFMFKPKPVHTDTLLADAVGRRKQHAPVSIHWHMQHRNSGELYARGWLEVKDAPPVEAGVARWFEVAAALGTRPDGVRGIPPDSLEVTSVALLRQPDVHTSYMVYLEMLAPLGVKAVDVDPARFALPLGYEETTWPGFVHEPRLSASLQTRGARWQRLEQVSAQRSRATCRAPWLPALQVETQR